MIDNLQSLEGKPKLNFFKNISNYYGETKHKNFQIQEDPLSKNSQGISKNYHEVLLLMKFLQTKPQVKNMNIKYYDLYCTVIKNRNNKDIIDDKNENNEKDYINLNDLIPSHSIGIKKTKEY